MYSLFNKISNTDYIGLYALNVYNQTKIKIT